MRGDKRGEKRGGNGRGEERREKRGGEGRSGEKMGGVLPIGGLQNAVHTSKPNIWESYTQNWSCFVAKTEERVNLCRLHASAHTHTKSYHSHHHLSLPFSLQASYRVMLWVYLVA